MDRDYVYGSANYTFTLGGTPIGPKFEHVPEVVGYQTYTGRNQWKYNYTSDSMPAGGMIRTSFSVNAYELRNFTHQHSMYINWRGSGNVPPEAVEPIQYNVESLRTVQNTINTTSSTNRLKSSFETSYNGSAATARLMSVNYVVPLYFSGNNSRVIGLLRFHRAEDVTPVSSKGFFYKATSTASLLIGNKILGTRSWDGDGVDGRGSRGYGLDYTAIKTNDTTDNGRFFMQSASARSADNYAYMKATILTADEPITFRFNCVGSPYLAPGLTVNNTASSNQVTYLTRYGLCTFTAGTLPSDTSMHEYMSKAFMVSATANYAIYQ